MQLKHEQVLEMAPDANSAAAGKKLMDLKNWEGIGRNAEAIWGLCKGSTIYQVKVDSSNLGYHCSCPSRKFPCKHVLSLLMIWANTPVAVTESKMPEWVAEWLARRKQREDKKVERQDPEPKSATDEKSKQRRVMQRVLRVSEGLDRLDLWLKDIVRNGLAGIEAKPPGFWEEQAKRLVDAQAPGLASRVARLSLIPRSSKDWPSKLLGEIGRIKLLIYAWRRIDDIEPALQNDIRQMLGWTIAKEDLESDGEPVDDNWVIIGQWIDEEDRIRAQRSWAVGMNTKRIALLLQFAPSGQAFAESIISGTQQECTMVFYPGAVRQRAKFTKRNGSITPLSARLPGVSSIDELLAGIARSIGRQPWLSAFGVVLNDVTVVPQVGGWLVRDGNGLALPLREGEYWNLLAVSGGRAFDLAGEWDTYRLRPLGFISDGTYRVV
jgi:hypothetical protein